MSGIQSLQNKIIKGSIIVIIIPLIGAICAYLFRLLLSRTLDLEGYGLFYAIFTFFTVVVTYVDLGFGYSTVYLMPKHLKAKNHSKAWNIFVSGQIISILISILACVLLVVFAPFLAQKYFKVIGSEILIYLFCLYLISAVLMNGLGIVYSSLQKEKYYSSITSLRWFFILFFSIIFAWFGFSNIFIYSISLTLGHILTVLIFAYLLFSRHKFLTSNKIIWKNKELTNMAFYAFPAFADTVVTSFSTAGGGFFLTLFNNVKVVGIYNVVVPLATIPIILLSPINALLLPLTSHLMEGEKDKLTHLIQKILVIMPFLGCYFVLFITLFPSSSVALIFGEKWLGLVELPLSFLAAGSVFMLMSGVLGAITLGTGKIRERFKISLFALLISILLNVVLIQKYSVLGAVIANILTSMLIDALFLKILMEVVKFKIPYLFYIKLICFSIAAFALVRLTKFSPHNWLEFIFAGLVYTLTYVLYGYLLKVYDKELILILIPWNTRTK